MAPPVLALRGAAVRIASQVLFEGVDVAVAKGDRVCLVGRNGSGKSTLLQALAGLVGAGRGRAVRAAADLGRLPGAGTGAAGDRCPPRYVMGGLPEAERAGAEYRADAVLEGLGLDPARAPAGLSGGEARRVDAGAGAGGRARTCCCWTSRPTTSTCRRSSGSRRELQGYRGGLVLVSHDRAFLTAAVADDLVARPRRGCTSATGASPSFEAWREEVLDAEEAALSRLDKKLEAETHWLHRGVTARRKRNMGRLRAALRAAAQRAAGASRPAGRSRRSRPRPGASRAGW